MFSSTKPDLLHVAVVVLAVLLILQQVRFYLARRSAKKREELFRIITENADDMIALVDMKAQAPLQQPFLQKNPGLFTI